MANSCLITTRRARPVSSAPCFNPAHVTVPKLSPLYQTELVIRRLTIRQVSAWSEGASSNDGSIGPVLSPLLARARLRTFKTTSTRSLTRPQNYSFLNLRRSALLKGESMPDRYPDQAAMHYLSWLKATISRRIVMNSKRFGKRHRSQRSV